MVRFLLLIFSEPKVSHVVQIEKFISVWEVANPDMVAFPAFYSGQDHRIPLKQQAEISAAGSQRIRSDGQFRGRTAHVCTTVALQV